jgi:superfamily II DNA or RNA helicase
VIELFPDQQEALNKVLERYKEMPIGGRALVVAPTAWGKTIFFSSLIHTLKSDKPVLIIAHRDELLDQARDKFHMFDPTAIVGKVGGGRHEYGAPITVASVDTISGEKHLEKLASFKYGLVIIDECHHAPAPKYQKVLNVLKEAFQLGVTATDERLDGKSLEPIFGKAIFRMPIVEAIAKKRLSDVKAIAIRTEVNLDDVKSQKNMDGEIDFNQTELNLAVNTPSRNRRIVEAYQEHLAGERAICFGVTVAHAQAISDAFNEAGIPSACVHGNTNIQPIEERKRIYTAFDKGEIKVVTNVLVLTEGFDAPKIKGILMARPTQSRGLWIQCVGRGLRKSPGKSHCLILDLTDNSSKYRLKTQSLRKAIKDVQDDETILEALEREKIESEEREIQVRKLKEKRLQDVQIDLFEKLEWKELPNDVFLLEVGAEKHKIALTPSRNNPELYYVQFKRSPFNGPHDKATNLTGENPQPIDWAQVEAEKAARKIIAESKSVFWMDKVNPSPRRLDMITENQKKMMDWKKIPYTDEMTKGEASDLIEAYMARKAKEKAEKEARKRAKQEA